MSCSSRDASPRVTAGDEPGRSNTKKTELLHALAPVGLTGHERSATISLPASIVSDRSGTSGVPGAGVPAPAPECFNASILEVVRAVPRRVTALGASLPNCVPDFGNSPPPPTKDHATSGLS